MSFFVSSFKLGKQPFGISHNANIKLFIISRAFSSRINLRKSMSCSDVCGVSTGRRKSLLAFKTSIADVNVVLQKREHTSFEFVRFLIHSMVVRSVVGNGNACG
jgi:hypothetical protein